MWVSQLSCKLSSLPEGSWNYWVLHKAWSLTLNFEGDFQAKQGQKWHENSNSTAKIFEEKTFRAVHEPHVNTTRDAAAWAGGKGAKSLSWTVIPTCLQRMWMWMALRKCWQIIPKWNREVTVITAPVGHRKKHFHCTPHRKFCCLPWFRNQNLLLVANAGDF